MTKKQCPAKTVFLGVNVDGVSVFKTEVVRGPASVFENTLAGPRFETEVVKVSAWGDRDPPAVRFLTLLLRRPGKRYPNHRDDIQVD